jgi:hypothetical protein
MPLILIILHHEQENVFRDRRRIDPADSNNLARVDLKQDTPAKTALPTNERDILYQSQLF